MKQESLKPLYNFRFLITRPYPQNQSIVQRIRNLGGTPIEFPLIRILPLSIQDECADIDRFIFTSEPAVWHSQKILSGLQTQHALYAIGPKTALGLPSNTVTVAPFPHNSEALLTLPDLQNVKNIRIGIVKGLGGRSLIRNTLSARGAEVTEICVYRREPLSYSSAVTSTMAYHCAMVTSNEILQRYYDVLVSQNQDNLSKPLVISSQRQAVLAKKLGFESIMTAHSAQDDVILEQFIEWSREAHGKQ